MVAYLDNQFYPTAIERLSHALQGQGYHILVFMAPNSRDKVDEVMGELLDYQVDGIIAASMAMTSDLTARCDTAGIPDEKVLLPGVVDTTTNFVEHPELLAQRIERFIDIVETERVIAGSDYGFGTFAGFGAVDPDIAYAKLRALTDGAALAAG